MRNKFPNAGVPLHTLSKLYDALLVLFSPPPLLSQCLVLFALAEGWLLFDIGWFVLLLISKARQRKTLLLLSLFYSFLSEGTANFSQLPLGQKFHITNFPFLYMRVCIFISQPIRYVRASYVYCVCHATSKNTPYNRIEHSARTRHISDGEREGLHRIKFVIYGTPL